MITCIQTQRCLLTSFGRNRYTQNRGKNSVNENPAIYSLKPFPSKSNKQSYTNTLKNSTSENNSSINEHAKSKQSMKRKAVTNSSTSKITNTQSIFKERNKSLEITNQIEEKEVH